MYPIDFLKGAIGYTLQKPGHMVWKRVNSVHNDKIRSNGLGKQSIGFRVIKLDQMVLKVVNWVHIQKSGHMVLKGVIWFEMSDLGTQYKHQVKWS